MLVISHRGNLEGPSEEENSPDYILEAVKKYPVEVDVWKTDEGWFLGHDSPQYPVDPSSFFTTRMWLHCKNLDAVRAFNGPSCPIPWLRWFWHETDKLTLTSLGDIWTFPDVEVGGIVVDHGTPRPLKGAFGVCTDYPDKWARYIEENNG